MVSNLAPDNDQEINTHFSEQRVVESQQAYESSNMSLSSQVEAEMGDDTWLAKQQLMKPVQLAQVSWNTTQARDTEIYAVNFPQVLENIDSIVLRTLSMYAFYKLSPCFRVQINATQFHQGQLLCSFDPFSISSRTESESLSPFFDIFYASGLPNVKIMASESDAVELCVPFIHPRSFLTTNDATNFNNLGAFRISILNPLVVAEGTSPSITVTIWVYAKDAQVHVPIFDHKPLLDGLTDSPSLVATSAFINDFSSQFSGLTSQLKQLASPIISSVQKGAKQIHTLYGNVISGNVGQALRTGQGLVDTLGDLFGFDYPARTIQPPKTISAVENLAVSIGQSQSQRMALDPFSLHHLADEVAGESIDSMNLMKIAQMPMLLSQFQFLGTSAADSQLFSCPINPTISAFKNNHFRRTYLSAVSNAFVYWSGGINFDIEVVATRFHSGKLLFAFVPNDSAIPTYAQAATSLPNIIVDLQQSSSTRFKIPYVSSTPMKNCQKQYTITGSTVEDVDFIDSCIGTMVCYVQNTLAYASNVAPSVEVNIYVSAADDFSLYVPARPTIDQVFTPPTTERILVATSNQIGIDLNKNNDVNTASVLAKGSGISIPRKHFGENYSLIDLLRRFNYLNEATVTTTDYTTLPITPLRSNLEITNDNNYPILSYFATMYSAFSGTIRYKFVPQSSRIDRTQLTILHVPSFATYLSLFKPNDTTLTTPSEFQGFATLLTQTQQDAAIEFEVPYYSKYNMLLLSTFGIIPIDNFINGYVLAKIKGPLADDLESLTYDIYFAAGEDFRFVYVRPLGLDYTNVGYTVPTL
jgi:hypothetical protein